MKCEHKELAPKQHPDGPEGRMEPACVECGVFVVRGECHIVIPLDALLGRKQANGSQP